ncbi:hypothetical protein F7725_021846, partial [Dissostichus mawsoni]
PENQRDARKRQGGGEAAKGGRRETTCEPGHVGEPRLRNGLNKECGEAVISPGCHCGAGTSHDACPDTKPKGCAGCNRKIKDRYLLKALDKYWHEDCLKCACCDCRLGEVGSTLYTKANLILCRRDYLRQAFCAPLVNEAFMEMKWGCGRRGRRDELFGVTGNCAACSKLIPAFEMVMRAKENVYHLDCFACQLCNQRFCVGDKFFLKNNMILCQTDYEEGLMKEGYAPQVR